MSMPISCSFFFHLPWLPWDTSMATRISFDLRKITRFGDRGCRRVMYSWMRYGSSLMEATVIASRVLAMLRAGDFVRVAAISRVIDPWLTELVGKFGFDLLWLDMEHRPFGY